MSNTPSLGTPPKKDWRGIVSRIVKAEMGKRGLRYEDLRAMLLADGTDLTAQNLCNKINRGIMGSDLFVQIMTLMGAQLPDDETMALYQETMAKDG